MTTSALADALGDEKKIEELAGALRAEAAATPKEAVQFLLGSDEDLAAGARRLFLELGELSIGPLLETNPPKPEQRVEALRLAVDAQDALRRKIAERLVALLDDKAPVPVRRIPVSEKQPPPRRVCDDAYLLMRKLMNLGEPPDEAYQQADMFLNAPDGFKDETIAKARTSGVWNREITPADVYAYIGSHPNAGGPPPAPAPPGGHPVRR